MGPNRDWDKVRRETRVFKKGSISHWLDGWVTDSIDGPAAAARTEKSTPTIYRGQKARQVMVRLRYSGGVPEIVPPMVGGLPDFRGDEIEEIEITMDKSTYLEFRSNIIGGININDMDSFINALPRVADFHDMLIQRTSIEYIWTMKKRPKKRRGSPRKHAKGKKAKPD